MTYPHGNLTPEQIRSTFFVVPDLGIAMAYGAKFFKEFQARRTTFREKGGDLLLIAWPDGTTLIYERPDPLKAFDVEDLAAFYQKINCIRAELEAQGVTI